MDGWEPRKLIEHEHDADGRLVRSVEYRESEWDDEQRDLALAFHRYVSDLGPHGHLMSEATDPGADPMEYGVVRFVSDDPVMDWAAKAKSDAEKAWRASNGDDADMAGLIFPVRKVVRSALPE